MDISVQIDKRLVISILVGETVTVSWFYEALRIRRLFNTGWIMTSFIATTVIAVLLQMITRKLRPIYSIKQAFSTALWLAIFFSLVELSHNSALFNVTIVARAAVHGAHKFLLVFSILFVRVFANPGLSSAGRTGGAPGTSDGSSSDGSSSSSGVTSRGGARGAMAQRGPRGAMARVMTRGVRPPGMVRPPVPRGPGAPRGPPGPPRGVRPRGASGPQRPRMK